MEIVNKIALRFNEKGYELYLVGGYVRDTILGRETHDVDMCTDAKPEKIKMLLEDLGAIYDVGIKFGTVGLVVGDTHIEITTFRGETYSSDSRKPEVSFGDNLTDDLSRRDFTINSMVIDLIALVKYYEQVDEKLGD